MPTATSTPRITLIGKNIAGVAARGKTIVVAVDAADSNRLQDGGIFRSIDTGSSFTPISSLKKTNGLPAGWAYDLAGDPKNPSMLYTAVVSAGSDNGVYRSTDTGATWTRVSDASINKLFNDFTTTNVKIAVGNANNVYVGIENLGVLSGLFRSGNGGANPVIWNPLDLPTTNESGTLFGINPGSQGGLDLSIVADPTNPNLVYVGGDRQPAGNEAAVKPGVPPTFPNSIGAQDYSGRLFRIDASKPRGSQFAHLTNCQPMGKTPPCSNVKGPALGGTASNSSPHADSRAMSFDANGNLLEVDDGGIFRRTSPQTNAGDWFSIDGTLQATEFHDITFDGNSRIVLGGAQDTGTPQQQISNGTVWTDVARGDGGDVESRPAANPGFSLRYSSSTGFSSSFRIDVYDAKNVKQATVFPFLKVVSGDPLTPQFYTPIKANAVDPNRVIIGAANGIYESLDQGTNLREVGKGIVANDSLQRKAMVYGGRSGGTNNPDVIYVGGTNRTANIGSGDQMFVRTAAAPAAFTELTNYPGKGSGREVNGIVVAPSDYKTAYVVDTSHVYVTNDTGMHWKDITGILSGNFDSIEFVNNRGINGIVVGTDSQVFASLTSALGTWNQLGLGAGLPQRPGRTFELRRRYGRAGGRNSWTRRVVDARPARRPGNP